MKKLCIFITTSIGWSLGWWLGEFINIIVAIFGATIVMTAAWYYTSKIYDEFLGDQF